MSRVAIAVAAFSLWSGVMFGAGWAWRGDRADGAEAKQQVSGARAESAQVQQVRKGEHQQAQAMAEIGAKHEQDRREAEAVPDSVVAELRAGTLRLRDGWASCETQRLSDAATATRERDAAAQRRAEFAGAIVRVGRDADAQLRACQAVIEAERQ